MNTSVAFVIVLYKQRVDTLKKQLSNFPVYIIDNSKNNRGFGAAANIGLAQAYREGVTWVVLLNQDVEIINVNQLVKNIPTSPCISGPFAGALDQKRWTTIFPSKVVDYVSGSCMAIHKDVYKKIGGFYEPYFLYYEDVDFCVRAKNAGFPLIKMHGDFIKHTDNKYGHEFYLARNHLLFVFRCAPIHVKLYELFRLPKTLYEYWR